MPIFGGRSLRNLAEADSAIQTVMRAAIVDFDFIVLQSSRTREEQEADFAKGVSKAHWLQSAHDFSPSYAVDCCPYPVNWNDIRAFKMMSVVILSHAKSLGVDITWGGSWKNIKDFPHFELTGWRELVKNKTTTQLIA